MRYHYQQPEKCVPKYGRRYVCNHPIYNVCTLFVMDGKGLAVIQQDFNPKTKKTFWKEISPCLANDIFLHPKFKEYFEERAGTCTDGLYPTVTVRQIMWALKMKPLPKERWETVFDRRDI